MGKNKLGFVQKIRCIIKKPVVWMMLFASLLLAGCVDYDVGVNFSSTNQGEIVQHIKLGDQLAAFSKVTAQEWLNSIEHRAQDLDGKIKHVSDRELTVTIPFNNGEELEAKFNQFFNPTDSQKSQEASSAADLPKVQSRISLQQGNFLLFVRNNLQLDIDLRSLLLASADGNVVINPGSGLELQFSLNTPWGATSVINVENAIAPESSQDSHQLIWQLQPGQINHLEAVFWLPSPLGIGTLIIALLVIVGIFVKHQLLPGNKIGRFPKTKSA